MATIVGVSKGGKESEIVDTNILSAEKRRGGGGAGGKYYSYQVEVIYADGEKSYVWRRYSQFDALRQTLQDILGPTAVLPRLTSKLYLKRSSVHTVALNRMPKLQKFLGQMISMGDNIPVQKTLMFFLTPSEDDLKRAALPDPEGVLYSADVASSGATPRASIDMSGQSSPAVPGYGVAMWAYTGVLEDELSFNEGDELTLISRPAEEWYEGGLNGLIGLVPANYLEVHQEPTEAAVAEATTAAPAQQGKPGTPEEELRTTEAAYLTGLKEVRDSFFPKLRHFVTAQEAKLLFNNWVELIPLSEALLVDLNKDLDKVADTLSHHLPLLSAAYSKYCSGIPAAQAVYETKIQEKTFKEFESGFTQLNKPTLNYLMRPVQRLMKYPLLLSEITKTLKKYNPESSDLPKLQAAVEAATDLAAGANTNMDQSQKRLEKLDISGPDSFQILVTTRNEDQHDAMPSKLAGPAASNGGSAVFSPPKPSSPIKPSSNAVSVPLKPPPPAATPKVPKPPTKPEASSSSGRPPPPTAPNKPAGGASSSSRPVSTHTSPEFLRKTLKPVSRPDVKKAAPPSTAPKTAVLPNRPAMAAKVPLATPGAAATKPAKPVQPPKPPTKQGGPPKAVPPPQPCNTQGVAKTFPPPKPPAGNICATATAAVRSGPPGRAAPKRNSVAGSSDSPFGVRLKPAATAAKPALQTSSTASKPKVAVLPGPTSVTRPPPPKKAAATGPSSRRPPPPSKPANKPKLPLSKPKSSTKPVLPSKPKLLVPTTAERRASVAGRSPSAMKEKAAKLNNPKMNQLVKAMMKRQDSSDGEEEWTDSDEWSD